MEYTMGGYLSDRVIVDSLFNPSNGLGFLRSRLLYKGEGDVRYMAFAPGPHLHVNAYTTADLQGVQ